jgi:hypothetical protein
MRVKPELLTPDWPAPANIHAFSTTRLCGESEAVYAGLNLALHVGDDTQTVEKNRAHLSSFLRLPGEPLWLNQVHQTGIVNAAEYPGIEHAPPDADASFSVKPNQVCIVMTADCLPVLVCNRRGNKVAAIHAGWRGLAEGVIESAIAALHEPADQLLVWLGPAIGPQAFEVGEEVRAAFISKFATFENITTQVALAFTQNRAGHYLADIYQLARLTLQTLGIGAVYGGEHCTFNDADHFYSYRRDATTGRQASLIWFS